LIVGVLDLELLRIRVGLAYEPVGVNRMFNTVKFKKCIYGGRFKFKREFVSKKCIHNKMEKSFTLLFNVVPVDCHTLVPTFWKPLNSSFKEGFRLLVYPTFHSCNNLIIIGISCLLKPSSLVQTNDNQMELSLDCTVDKAGHPTSYNSNNMNIM
jgi:hypothetical protein